MSLTAANAPKVPVVDDATSDDLKTARRDVEHKLRDAHRPEYLVDRAAGVAHELSNILTPILGYIELATSMLPADSPVQPMLHEIGDAARRAADLVPRLLDSPGREPESFASSRLSERVESKPTDEERSLTGKSVLVVDDDERILMLARILLQSFGTTVRAAATGAEALAIAADLDYPLDVVVLDWMLPGTDGAVVARQLRTLRPGLPIVLSSGCGDDELAKSIDLPPNTDWIAKPYSAGELRGVLQRAIDAGSHKRE